MKILVNLAGLDSTVIGLITKAQIMGATLYPRWQGAGDISALGFDTAGEKLITVDEWTAIKAYMTAGAIPDIYGAMVYLELPNTVLDNLMQVDLPGAKMTTVVDDVETETRLTYQQRLPVVATGTDNSLLLIRVCTTEPEATAPTGSELAEFSNKWGTLWSCIQSFIDLAETNSYNILHSCEVSDWVAANSVSAD